MKEDEQLKGFDRKCVCGKDGMIFLNSVLVCGTCMVRWSQRQKRILTEQLKEMQN